MLSKCHCVGKVANVVIITDWSEQILGREL